MSEEEVVTQDTPDEDAAIAAEVATITASPQEQQADKVRAALIAAKKGEKAAKKRIAELEPVAARATEIETQLQSAQPVINAILSDPRLRAEALRIAGGKPPARQAADAVDDDPDAADLATEMGLFLADQVTPNVVAARKILTRLDARHGRQTDERIRPLAGVTLGQKADANIAQALAETDDDGVPYATAESIREVAAQLPPQLLADPKVVKLVLTSAIGVDKMNRRTPKAAPDPLYLAPAAGRRQAPGYSADEKRAFAAVGLTEADLKRTTEKLEKAGGKAVVFGS
jgi:hypothetical protein